MLIWYDLTTHADFGNGSCHSGSSGSETKRGSVRMWHMDMISDCQSVASLRWTARTIWYNLCTKGLQPAAYLTLEREFSEAIEVCRLQAQILKWWSNAWCPSSLNPNRRTANRLKTQGRDVSSGECSPAKFPKAGPACMQEWPRLWLRWRIQLQTCLAYVYIYIDR